MEPAVRDANMMVCLDVSKQGASESMRNAVTCVVGLLLLVGCGDAPGRPPTRQADLVGAITAVTPFEPVTEGCTPPEQLDPNGAVSSDDPPVCTDADSDIEGTILVEASRGEPVGGLGDKASSRSADARPPFGSAGRPTRSFPVRSGNWCPAKPCRRGWTGRSRSPIRSRQPQRRSRSSGAVRRELS